MPHDIPGTPSFDAYNSSHQGLGSTSTTPLPEGYSVSPPETSFEEHRILTPGEEGKERIIFKPTDPTSEDSSLPEGFEKSDIEGRELIRPTSTIAKPQTPVGKEFEQRESGIIAPVEGQKGAEVLVANKEDIAKLSTKEEKPLPEKTKSDMLLFASLPLTYFDKKLKEYGVESPVEEMEEIIAKEGHLDVADLKYNKWHELKQDGEVPENFYTFLENSTDILVDDIVTDKRYVKQFFKAANLLIETQIYANRCYKLKDAKPLEKVLRLFDEANIPLSNEVCDFVSYFEIPPSLVEHINENIKPGSKHALKYYTDSLVKGEQEGEIENVGIEIEGIAKVALGKNSYPGFKMGIDGDARIPELRREKQSVRYDLKFKEDLYELWYWAKMSRLMGLSLHIHLDNEDEQQFGRFQRVFGSHFHSVRVKNPSDAETVEIRLNLPFYPEKQKDDRKFLPKQTSLSDSQIYVLQPLIDELIKVKNSEEVHFLQSGLKIAKTGTEEELLGQHLCSWWRRRFSMVHDDYPSYPREILRGELIDSRELLSEKSITADEARAILQSNSDQTTLDVLDLAKNIKEEELTEDLATEILEFSEYERFIAIYLLDAMQDKNVSVDFIRNVLEKHPSDIGLIIFLTEKINPSLLTKEFSMELISLSNYDERVSESVFKIIDNEFFDLNYITQYLKDKTPKEIYSTVMGIANGIDPLLLTVEVSDGLIELVGGESDTLLSTVILRMEQQQITPDLVEKYLDLSEDPSEIADDILINIDSQYLTREFLEDLFFSNSNINLDSYTIYLITDSVSNETLDDENLVYELIVRSYFNASLLKLITQRKGDSYISTNFIEGLLYYTPDYDTVPISLGPNDLSAIASHSSPGAFNFDLIKSIKSKLGSKFSDFCNSTGNPILSESTFKEVLSYKGDDFALTTYELYALLRNVSNGLSNIEMIEELIDTDYISMIPRVIEKMDPNLIEMNFIKRVFEIESVSASSMAADKVGRAIIRCAEQDLLTHETLTYMFNIIGKNVEMSEILLERVHSKMLNQSFIADILLWSGSSVSVIDRIIEKSDSSIFTQDFAKVLISASHDKYRTARSLVKKMDVENLDERFIETIIYAYTDEQAFRRLIEVIPEKAWNKEIFWLLVKKYRSFSKIRELFILDYVNKELFDKEFLKQLEKWFEVNPYFRPHTLKTVAGGNLWINVDYNSKTNLEVSEQETGESELSELELSELELSMSELSELGIEARETEEFLNDVFTWIAANTRWVNSSNWAWSIHEGGIVNMRLTNVDSIPLQYVDAYVDTPGISSSINQKGYGIPNLIREIGERKVISIKSSHDWYLKIISE